MLKFTACVNGEAFCSFERGTVKEAIETTKHIIEEDQLNPEEVTLYFFESDEMISLDEISAAIEPLDLICDIQEYMYKKGLEDNITVAELLNVLSLQQNELEHYRNECEALQSTMYQSGDY
jgi:hypothetical protein